MVKAFVMDMISSVSLLNAGAVASFACPFFMHQEKEPDAVRKLRKF